MRVKNSSTHKMFVKLLVLNKKLEFCFLMTSSKELNIGQLKNKSFDGQSPVSSLVAGQMIDCFLYLEHG